MLFPSRLCVRLACAALSLVLTGAAEASAASRGGQGGWIANALGSNVPMPIAGGVVSTDDLLRLRDLGGLGVSPNGEWIAFSLRQADPVANDYSMKWFVMRTHGRSVPKVMRVKDGRPITYYSSGLPYGYVPADPPKWSVDGRWIALRQRVGERIELWIANPTTGAAKRIDDGASQVTSFVWSQNGELIYRTGFNADRYKRDVSEEAKGGWLLDQRMSLIAAREPSPLPPDCEGGSTDAACDTRTLAVGVDGATRLASPEEVTVLDRDLRPLKRAPARVGVGKVSEIGKDGFMAWTEPVDVSKAAASRPVRRLMSNRAGGETCPAAACVGQNIKAVGLARGGRSVWFVRSVSSLGDSERGGLDETELLEWRPDIGDVRTILRGSDVLDGCVARERTLYCDRSSATHPNHIVAIDLDSRVSKVLVEPNPTIATKVFPALRKMKLEDPSGDLGWAYVVYPNDYKAGTAYPIVVVQYRCSGFLRGGTGDEYPIFPLASEGFAVLCIDSPYKFRAASYMTSAEGIAYDNDGDREMHNLSVANERAIDSLISEGIADKRRVAITGLSNGADVLHYTIQRTDRFAAAIASSGSGDLSWFAQIPLSPRTDMLLKAYGIKNLVAEAGSQLFENSWSQHPERLRTPLLINMGQAEALWGFEGLMVLKYARRPLEVRIFPDEGHIKYHPQSFAGIYKNNIMWLKYWLMDKKDASPKYVDQYKRWDEMRKGLDNVTLAKDRE